MVSCVGENKRDVVAVNGQVREVSHTHTHTHTLHLCHDGRNARAGCHHSEFWRHVIAGSGNGHCQGFEADMDYFFQTRKVERSKLKKEQIKIDLGIMKIRS